MNFTEAQVQLVQAVAASAGAGGWERLLANVELLEHASDFQLDYVCLAVVREKGELSVRQFRLSDEARDAAVAFYRQRREEAGERIGGVEVAIDPDGRYRVDVEHGAPKRINGEWDEAREERLDHYLDHYKAELAARR